MRRGDNIWENIDKVSIVLYLVLVLMGWLNIYAAVYNEDHQNIFDISQKYGKQLIWISTSILIAGIILLIDNDFYTVFAYVIYGFFIVLNLLVPFLGKEIKGSRSWFRFGDFGLQPAEFMKFATSLALSKFLSNQHIKISDYKNTLISIAIIGMPLIIIKQLQDETGLAIVFVIFILALYREGLSVNYLLLAFVGAILFIMALLVSNIYLFIIIGGLCLISLLFIKRNRTNMLVIALIGITACGIVKGTSTVYEKLEPHQKTRIDVLLGRGNVNLKKEGYNVNQAKIAIGSGGFWGKGYLQGTQTKFDFVPEQDTDFIFCTVGEEWGFVGSTIVITLFMILIVRIVLLAERQRSSFSRVYGYCVACILFFHLTINVGMTMGLMPVIGIPLPFFSYGGSSLWSFTILLFIFLKLDAYRLQVFR